MGVQPGVTGFHGCAAARSPSHADRASATSRAGALLVDDVHGLSGITRAHESDDELRETAEAHEEFKRACARAFAGTRWKPYRYDAHAKIGGVFHTIVLELTMRDALNAQLDPPDIFPRSAAVRDPRFALRGQHPKRGRHARRRR